MSKQDRLGIRRASDVEQKYDFSALKDMDKSFSQQSEKIRKLEENMTQLSSMVEEKIRNMYPVGSYYISTSQTNPTELFGGEWEAYGDGHLVFGTDTEYELYQFDETCFVWKRIA